MANPATIKIRFRGKLMGNKWVYQHPRIVDLPIPYAQKSMREGEVACNPVGEFPYADGMRLLEMSGPDGPFVLEEEPEPEEDEEEEKPDEAAIAAPVAATAFVEIRPDLLQKRINAAKLRRGIRRRKVRSDKGVPKPRTQIAADTPVQAQADSEPTPQVAAG